MKWLERVNGSQVKVYTVTGQTYSGRLDAQKTDTPVENQGDTWVEVYNEETGKIAFANLRHTSGISVTEK